MLPCPPFGAFKTGRYSADSSRKPQTESPSWILIPQELLNYTTKRFSGLFYILPRNSAASTGRKTNTILAVQRERINKWEISVSRLFGADATRTFKPPQRWQGAPVREAAKAPWVPPPPVLSGVKAGKPFCSKPRGIGSIRTIKARGLHLAAASGACSAGWRTPPTHTHRLSSACRRLLSFGSAWAKLS